MSQIIEGASAIVNNYPATRAELDEHAIHVIIENPHGSSFSLIDEGAKSTLLFGNWHYPFSEEDEALKTFEKCLSGEAQLREITSLGIPYKGFLEVYEGESEKPVVSYVTVTILILFLWPFPKKEKRYRNALKEAAADDGLYCHNCGKRACRETVSAVPAARGCAWNRYTAQIWAVDGFASLRGIVAWQIGWVNSHPLRLTLICKAVLGSAQSDYREKLSFGVQVPPCASIAIARMPSFLDRDCSGRCCSFPNPRN